MRLTHLLSFLVVLTTSGLLGVGCSSDSTSADGSSGAGGTAAGASGNGAGGGVAGSGGGGAGGAMAGSGGNENGGSAGNGTSGAGGVGGAKADGGMSAGDAAVEAATGPCAVCTQPVHPAACPANPGNVNYCMEGASCCDGAQQWGCLCLAETCTFHPCGKL